MHISSIILSGGLARRMDGANKGMLPLRGKPLIAHVIERISPQVSELLINANQNAAAFQQFNLPVLPDLRTGFPGPLAGIEAGLSYIQNTKSEYLQSLPCDSPLVLHDLAARLLAGLLQADAAIAVAASDGVAHPVFCLMKKSVLPSLQAFLDAGERKVSIWQKSQNYIEVDFSDCNEAFTNLNTFEDLKALELKL